MQRHCLSCGRLYEQPKEGFALADVVFYEGVCPDCALRAAEPPAETRLLPFGNVVFTGLDLQIKPTLLGGRDGQW